MFKSYVEFLLMHALGFPSILKLKAIFMVGAEETAVSIGSINIFTRREYLLNVITNFPTL